MGLENHWPKAHDFVEIARATEEIADRTIILGDDVARFLDGEIGQYILSRAREQLATALYALADETDPEKIRQFQFDARVARAIPEWLQDAINSGKLELELRLSKEGE